VQDQFVGRYAQQLLGRRCSGRLLSPSNGLALH
jgi:hypothetical protein